MYRIWFEREMPPQFAPLLDGVAVKLGPVSATPDAPLSALPEAQGIVASILHYDASVMAQAPELRVISRTGIGYDRVDVDEATARGIAVCNAPDGPTISTAEHALTLMMGVAKKIKQAEHELRHSGKTDFFKDHFGLELYQKRLGLVGLGRIGGYVAKVAQALGMTVLAFDPFIATEWATELGVELVPTLNDLLSQADILSLHVPLIDETRHLINSETIAQMKRGAILINTSRGGLVDEAALLAALKSGHLSGAGLDVTDPEPAKPHNPLLHRQDVIVTAHIASATHAGKDRIYQTAITQVLQILRGEQPPHLVNPEVWPKIEERLK